MEKNLLTRRDDADSLYAQIAEGIVEQIESGDLVPGDRLPPERVLSERLSVNRQTLRRALRLLEIQGLLVRQQGAGTFVAEPKIDRLADHLVSFSRGMRKRGFLPGAVLLDFQCLSARMSIARELEIPENSEVYYFQRLRTLNQKPVLLEKFWVSVDRFPDLEDYDLVNRFIYDIFEEEYGLTVTRGWQSLEPVTASEYEASLLEIEIGAPLMLERRISYDENDQPIEYGKDLYRGDRFRFVTEKAPMEKS